MERISFNQLIQEAIKDTEIWNYYQIPKDKYYDFDINSKKHCIDFINMVFGAAEKTKCLNSYGKRLEQLGKKRLAHIITVFFLGFGIYKREESIRQRIDSRMDYYKKIFGFGADVQLSFSYLWFLVCLFHDLGYFQEKKIKRPRNEYLLTDMGARVGVPDCYSKDLCLKYFDWMKNNPYRPHIDHGIYGGMYMYNTLTKIRDEEYRYNAPDDKKNGWIPELDNIYRLASWIVMCHNIWFAYKQEDISKFEMVDLSSLIIHNHNYPIKYDEYPLYFFFILIDTIEAVKRFNTNKPLNNIFISVDNDIITIENNLSEKYIEKYDLSKNDLDKWLTKVEIDGNRTNIYLHP